MSSPAGPFDDGLAAFALALVDPAGLGGVRLRARHGPARDAWLAAARRLLPERAPQLRCPATVETGRLLGGLDTAATLAAGKPIIQTGLLASADGGMLLFAMAERLPRRVAAIIADCMDRGMACTERDGLSAVLPTRFLVLALDEGIDDEAPPAILCNRLAFTVELGPDARPVGAPPDRAEISAARAVLPSVTVPETIERALAQLSLTIAPRSMRIALQLMRAARAAAALRGAATVSGEDAALALRLVIGAPAVAEMAEALAGAGTTATVRGGRGGAGAGPVAGRDHPCGSGRKPAARLAGTGQGRRPAQRGIVGFRPVGRDGGIGARRGGGACQPSATAGFAHRPDRHAAHRSALAAHSSP